MMTRISAAPITGIYLYFLVFLFGRWQVSVFVTGGDFLELADANSHCKLEPSVSKALPRAALLLLMRLFSPTRLRNQRLLSRRTDDVVFPSRTRFPHSFIDISVTIPKARWKGILYLAILILEGMEPPCPT